MTSWTFCLTVSVTLALVPLLTSCRQQSAPSGPTTSHPYPVTSPSGIHMVFLPGGEFTMGSDRRNPDEAPPHRVRVSPFLIDTYEVTHEMFAKMQLPNPSKFKESPQNPVESVRWRDAKIYCNERSLAEGLAPCYDETKPGLPCDFSANGYRLPTEAEWEFACRAGSSGDFDFGAASKLTSHAYYEANAQGRTHPVGTRRPNRWGIHDLYGNVSEWCQDPYDPDYYKTSPETDPLGPNPDALEVKRVIRGGSWKASADMCRASFRQGKPTGDSDACFSSPDTGFRCVRRITPESLRQLTTARSIP